MSGDRIAPLGLGVASRDAKTMMRYDANKKSLVVAYILWFFFAGVGAHRFYLKRTGSAVAMLIIFLVSLPLCLILVGFSGCSLSESGAT